MIPPRSEREILLSALVKILEMSEADYKTNRGRIPYTIGKIHAVAKKALKDKPRMYVLDEKKLF